MMRRRFLAGSLGAGIVGTSGCVDRDDSAASPPDPADLSDGAFDTDHGMEIGPHGGANGQIFYRDASPRDGGNPAWFHTLAHSMFPYHFERLDRGWEPEVVYVTDFSAVDYTVRERDGMPRMPSPTSPETFADATDLTYVAESGVMGGMGPALHPFSSDQDADAFVSTYGGTTFEFGAIDRALIEGVRDGGGHQH